LEDALFSDEQARRRSEIHRLSYTQRVPGLDPEDVEEELTVALWRACTSYDPDSGATLGQWWWSLWMNRKADLIDGYFRKKRLHPAPMDPEEVVGLVDALSPLLRTGDLPIPHCPCEGTTERRVWVLLALGYPGQEVRKVLSISRRRFYTIIDGWKTPEVKALLLP
jgi:hypothetical protein